MATALIGGALALLVGAAVWSMARDRRRGKHSCGGDCARCKGCH